MPSANPVFSIRLPPNLRQAIRNIREHYGHETEAYTIRWIIRQAEARMKADSEKSEFQSTPPGGGRPTAS